MSYKFDKEKYTSGSIKLGMRYIYVEGKLDKLIYENLSFFSKIANIKFEVSNMGSSNISKTIAEHSSKYGIIDNDYNYKPPTNRIARIDYYSIENLLLLRYNKLTPLRTMIKEFIILKGVNKIRLNNIELIDNKLVKINKISTQYHNYIRSNITDSSQFKKYAQLKDVVNKYIQGKHRKQLYKYMFTKIKYCANLINIDCESLFKAEDIKNLDFL